MSVNRRFILDNRCVLQDKSRLEQQFEFLFWLIRDDVAFFQAVRVASLNGWKTAKAGRIWITPSGSSCPRIVRFPSHSTRLHLGRLAAAASQWEPDDKRISTRPQRVVAVVDIAGRHS